MFERAFLTRTPFPSSIALIVEVMDKSDGNLSKAADTLGVHRNTLSRKIKELKIKTRLSAR